MTAGILIARITLHSRISGKSQMDVRKGANDELVLTLGNESLANLGARRFPPAFCLPDDKETVAAVVNWLASSYREVVMIETRPELPPTTPDYPVKATATHHWD